MWKVVGGLLCRVSRHLCKDSLVQFLLAVLRSPKALQNFIELSNPNRCQEESRASTTYEAHKIVIVDRANMVQPMFNALHTWGNEEKQEFKAWNSVLKALSHLDVLASVWQGLKMYVKRWRTLNY